MSVKVTDKVNNAQVDKVVQFARGTGNEARAEFDSTWGTYRIVITVPKYRCSDVDYVHILQDHNRNLYTKLIDGPSSLIAPVLILGALPQSFAYVEPTVVMFPTATKCNDLVGDPLTRGIDNQLEQDAYYASIRSPDLYHDPITVQLAVRLKDSAGGYHYIRMPWKFPAGFTWPSVGQLSVEDAVIDWVSSQPEDTLLCPRFYGTSVG